MDIGIQTNTREAFIALGRVVGLALQQLPQQRPHYISIQGDFSSGKELFALAVDQVFNPRRYPNGITRDMEAETFLRPGNDGQPQTVFRNFRNRYAPSGSYFDECLRDFAAENPQARLVIASNISRPGSYEYYRTAKNMKSECLDVGVVVYKLGPGFTRGVDLTFRDDHRLARVVAAYRSEVEPMGSVVVAPPPRTLPGLRMRPDSGLQPLH
jgi:hypothetical protein